MSEIKRINSADFVEMSGFLRVQEKRLISAAALERLIDAPNLIEVFRLLSQNSDYDFSGVTRVDEAEPMLKAEHARVYALAGKLMGDSAVVELPRCRYDYHNARTALKAKHFMQRTPPPYVSVGGIPVEEIEQLAEPGADLSKSGLPEHIVSAAKEAEAAFEASANPQDIDIVLDRAMFAYMFRLCEAIGNAFITEYVQLSVDYYNIKTLMRVRGMQKGTAFLSASLVEGGKTPVAFFVEHYAKTPSAMAQAFRYRYFGDAVSRGVEVFEKTGNFSALERLLDSLLVRHLRQAKYIAYGAELLFAYLLSKENEIRQIRILLTCKQNEIGPEVLRERLRENYA